MYINDQTCFNCNTYSGPNWSVDGSFPEGGNPVATQTNAITPLKKNGGHVVRVHVREPFMKLLLLAKPP